MYITQTLQSELSIQILLISAFFPPGGGGGTQRAAKLCKYLPIHGWHIHVLTEPTSAVGSIWTPKDSSLLDELPRQSVTVHRTERSFLGVGVDNSSSWIEEYVSVAQRILATQPISAVIVTMSPFVLSAVGRRLRVSHGVPVIYDLRDPWALDGWHLYSSRKQWRIDLREMWKTLSGADGVVFNTNEARYVVERELPTKTAAHSAVIPNGYDEDDFVALSGQSKDLHQDFTIAHTGFFHTYNLYRYRGLPGLARRARHYRPERFDVTGRSPLHLLRAVRLLAQAAPEKYERLRLRFVGIGDESTRRLVQEHRIEHKVDFVGYVDHAQSIRELNSADALFLPLHGKARARARIVPGKTYEYIRSGKPILACLPEGDAADIVRESGLGFFADPVDPFSIATAIVELYDGARERAGTPWHMPESLMRFRRDHIARQFSDFLRQVIERDRRTRTRLNCP